MKDLNAVEELIDARVRVIFTELMPGSWFPKFVPGGS